MEVVCNHFIARGQRHVVLASGTKPMILLCLSAMPYAVPSAQYSNLYWQTL